MTRTPAYARGAAARQLRIIAGRWRGRRWRFPDTGLRPTPDRVRETLFNWLQPHLAGARCLDLFAGSGALGLEAASRGAASVVSVEADAAAAQALAQVAKEWGAAQVRVVRAEALQWLQQRCAVGPDGAAAAAAFDLVFLDPPFAAGLLVAAMELLTVRGWLAPGALVYTEQAREAAPPAPPAGWELLKSGAAGAVSYHLWRSAGRLPGAI